MKKPYAYDWKKVTGDDSLEYSESLGLYWKDGRVYDELSASHNGIIGVGAQLKRTIKENNHG